MFTEGDMQYERPILQNPYLLFNVSIAYIISTMEQEAKKKIQIIVWNYINKELLEQDSVSEITLDKCCITDLLQIIDLRDLMDTEFRKKLIENLAVYESGESGSEKLIIRKFKQHPADITDVRLGLKACVESQNISSTCMDQCMSLYYDETNNCKKFRLNEEKNKFNVPADTVFVLGGIEANDTISFDELKVIFGLSDNVTEVKSHNIYEGTFERCLKSNKLEKYLDLLLSKGWHIHFNSLNLLYWSIVDILDSIEGFAMQPPMDVYRLKALFYRVIKSDLLGFFDLVLKYRYPDVNSSMIRSFMEELKYKCQSYKAPIFNFNFEMWREALIAWITKGANQDELVFVQDEEELTLLKELTLIYRAEQYTWINCKIIFDNEIDVIYSLKKEPISLRGEVLTNYVFVDSKSDPMVQLSDVAVGIIARYLSFIDLHGQHVESVIESSFKEKQMRILKKLNSVLKCSREYNPLFFNQTTSLEYHGLLNNLVDKYAL